MPGPGSFVPEYSFGNTFFTSALIFLPFIRARGLGDTSKDPAANFLSFFQNGMLKVKQTLATVQLAESYVMARAKRTLLTQASKRGPSNKNTSHRRGVTETVIFFLAKDFKKAYDLCLICYLI